MTTCQVSSKPEKAEKKGGTVHHDAADCSSFVKGLSPTLNGPLNAFYSAGPVLSLKPIVQPKLTIGKPNDKYEREADRVADKVMRMPEPGGSLVNSQLSLGKKEKESSLVQRQSTCPECPEKEGIQTKPVTEQITPLVQRQEEGPEEEEEEPVQTKPISNQITPLIQRQEEEPVEEEEESVQTKPLPGKSSQVTPGLQNRIHSLRGGGQPLPKSVRNFFEPRFGADFSHVRVHNDSKAAETAKSVNAKAFTSGKDVVFCSGQYSPGTSTGKRLLAHELTHVVQQNRKPIIQKKIEVNPGLNLDTMGYTTSKSGNIYTCPRIVKKSIWNELFTSLLNSPRIFKLKGATNNEINKNFKKHMTSRRGIVRFASKKKYRFGAGSTFEMNPTYWIVDSSGWRLKPGADRRKAIADLNRNPNKYRIACLAATQLTMEGGSNSPLKNETGVGNSDWIPGDWGYITNTAFPGSPIGQEGENIIYTGKNKFWGHIKKLNTYKTLIQWYNKVKSWHGSANIESDRDYPNAGLD